MKKRSGSKMVIASVLSAAMVTAFIPAVAFAANAACDTNDSTITSAAQERIRYAEAPAYTITKVASGTAINYALAVTPANHTVVKATIDGVDASIESAVTLNGSEKTIILIADADPFNAKYATKTIVLKNVLSLVQDWVIATSSDTSKLRLRIGNNTSKWLDIATIVSSVASGKTSFEAITEKYYAENTEVDAAVLSAWMTLYESVTAEAAAQIKAYENGANVIVDSKVFSMDAATYAAAVKRITNVEETVAANLKSADTDAAKALVYSSGVNDVIVSANDALKTAIENDGITRGDIKAAQAVTDALQVAKTGAEAKAAIEAYNKLTDVQKSLVPAADLDVARILVSQSDAQNALINAQDTNAINMVKDKTKVVKLAEGVRATKSKTTLTYKSQVSASGNKVTYKKVSGSSKIKVAKVGKVTMKKGAAKGKTYTAKVKVTCGEQTRNVTVKFVVR